jgi:hypothetical protein
MKANVYRVMGWAVNEMAESGVFNLWVFKDEENPTAAEELRLAKVVVEVQDELFRRFKVDTK